MQTLFRWVSRITDAIAATLLAVIFFTFLLQIGSRYTPRIIRNFGLEETFPTLAAVQPLGWTLELIAILWVWVIFFSCAFVVREWDHVKFDIIYLSVSRRTRTIFAIISAVAIVAGMLYALLTHTGLHRLDEDPQNLDRAQSVYRRQDPDADCVQRLWRLHDCRCFPLCVAGD